MGVDLGGTNGLIIGAAGSTGTDLAQRALDAGASRLVLCDTAASGAIDAPALDPRRAGVVLDVVRLERGDPIELAQLFACVRHDHGPLDWVCAVGGPGAPTRPAAPNRPASPNRPTTSNRTAAPARPDRSNSAGGQPGPRGARRVQGPRAQDRLAEVIELTPGPPPSPWPELSLARIVARTEQAFVRSALVTRLALEEFRHRGGALLHVWAGDGTGPVDALWEANRAAIEALVSVGDAPCSGIDDRGGVRLGFVETATGLVHDLAERLATLLGREPSPVVSLIRDNP